MVNWASEIHFLAQLSILTHSEWQSCYFNYVCDKSEIWWILSQHENFVTLSRRFIWTESSSLRFQNIGRSIKTPCDIYTSFYVIEPNFLSRSDSFGNVEPHEARTPRIHQFLCQARGVYLSGWPPCYFQKLIPFFNQFGNPDRHRWCSAGCPPTKM